MKKPTINFIVDLLALIAMIGLCVTGYIIKYTLPPGSGGRHRGQGDHIGKLLNMNRHDWGDIHFYIAIALVVLIIIHIALHYNWIKAYIKSLLKK